MGSSPSLRPSVRGLESQVALAAFQATDVGAVVAEDDGKGFLAEIPGLTVGPEVLADRPLQIALHGANRGPLLLDGLQTYK